MVAVHSWGDRHATSDVKKYVEAQKFKHKVLLKGLPIAETGFGVTKYPTNFWVDHRGKLVGREVSFLETPVALRGMDEKIEKLLAERKAAAKAGS